MRALAFLFLSGCYVTGDARDGGKPNPIDTCPELDYDCCRTDVQCLDYFGQDFPYCGNPGPQGICSQCQGESGCESGEVCDEEPDGFGMCVVP